MKTSIQTFDRNSTLPTSAERSPHEGESARNRPARFSVTMILAALALLVFGLAPADAHESPIGCTGSGLGIDLFAHIGDVHVGDTIRYSVRVFNSPLPACDATGIKASVTTPDGVSNSITAILVRTALAPGQSDFYTNVVTYVVRAQDVRPDGTVRATAQDNGDIHQNDTDSRGGGNQGVNTEVDFPCINVVVACTGQSNGTITYSGSVSNCGNTLLRDMTVSNFVNGALVYVSGPVTIATNQSINFSGSWIPANPCAPSTALILVQGTDVTSHSSNVVSSASTTCSIITTPGIQVTKVCPPTAVGPGQLLTFSGSVSNTGNVTLNNIVVVNDQPAPNTSVFTRATLAPGEVVTFTGSYTVPETCSTTSTLTANATSLCGVAVTSRATSTCPIVTAPAIAVTLVCPTTPITPGGIANYTGTVRNSGDITLNNVTVAQSGQILPPSSGLVGYWAFNETSGTVATDSSGNGNTGAIINATRVSGQSGNALSFNGTSAYVDIANSGSLNFAGPITLAAWIRPVSSAGYQNILAHGYSAAPVNEVVLRILDGQYQVGAYNGTAAPSLSAPMPAGDVGAWVHLGATFNGTTWTLYRNGVAIGSNSAGTPNVTVNANWAIGARGGGGERFFNGAIDDARIYNRALSATEMGTFSGSPLLFSAARLA